jgi:branched-chain amino acid transport system permease protein
MLDQLPQFLITGVTVGSIYALVGLGFAIIYNASDVVNFAQGEFVMIGAMLAISLIMAGTPFALALVLAALCTVAVGMALEKFAVEPARGASVVTLIIITIGASIFLRGMAQLVWGKNFHAMPHFSGETPLQLGGATLLPQNLWVMGGTAVLVLAVRYFFNHTSAGCCCWRTASPPCSAPSRACSWLPSRSRPTTPA